MFAKIIEFRNFEKEINVYQLYCLIIFNYEHDTTYDIYHG
jgi:hypothetical protein